MANNQSFSSGVLREQWSNATQPTDPTPAGYTAWNASGVITTTRALTAQEAAQLAALDTNTAASTNQSTIQQQAQAALAANRNDQTQDAAIQSSAVTISGTAGTFTLAQCTTFIKQLAQAVNTLAGNDVNTKKELNSLIRLVLNQFDGTN